MSDAFDDSPYELWVLRLRAWATDPSVQLKGLPRLEVDSFSPATYDRFFKHLQGAVGLRMQRWSQSFQLAMNSVRTEHDRARELVRLRTELAERLVLARHPSLPHQISDALLEGARVDVLSIQRQLEESTMAAGSRGSADRAEAERRLRCFQQNSMMAIFEPQVKTGGTVSSENPPFCPPTRPGRRRVNVDV